MTLHHLLDWEYGQGGPGVLRRLLDEGADPNARSGPIRETPLHVATRRRRKEAVEILLEHGAGIDERTAGGKTAYAHAARRGFDELTRLLSDRGASTLLSHADLFAVAVIGGDFAEAQAILASRPGVARTGNVEDDRLLADVAGREASEPVDLLIRCGADLTAPGLDSGMPLHQAAWFGQPANARLLLGAGAPVDLFEPTHEASPLGWAVHGSRYSGGSAGRQDTYVALVRMLLEAGSSLRYPDEADGDRYKERLLADASPQVREVLRAAT